MNLDFHYYEHEPAGKRKMRIIGKALAAEAARQGKPFLNILDVGCGNGHLTAFMASLGHQVVGTDSSGAALAEAAKRYTSPRVTFRTEIGLTEKYDVVTAFEVLEHLAKIEELTPIVQEHLGANGLFLISVPNGWSLEEIIRRWSLRTEWGKRLKQWLRSSNMLPASHSQSEAESPHIRFWTLRRWQRELAANNFIPEQTYNVSLFFKQLYYLGGRRFISPAKSVFRFFDMIDGWLVRYLPRFLADGWIMTWRKSPVVILSACLPVGRERRIPLTTVKGILRLRPQDDSKKAFRNSKSHENTTNQ